LTVLPTLRVDTTSPPPTALHFTITSEDFDPYLIVYSTEGGTCVDADVNDDFNGARDTSQLDVALTTVDDTTVFMATSYDPNVLGTYTRTITPTLCGLAVPDVTTFNNCARAMSMSSAFTCESAPCERDGAGALTGRACCVDTDNSGACRTTVGQVNTFVSGTCN
jgi:hypothetical protein